jgi:AraC-like DNA-binding protein
MPNQLDMLMGSDFALLEHHLSEPRRPVATGKLVLTRIAAGRSVLGAPAPSLKLVLEGEQLFEIDGRTLRVGAGQFLYLDAGASCVGINRSFTTGICVLLPFDEGLPPAPETGGCDPVLGRALVLSAATSRLGRELHEVGRRLARDHWLGPAIASTLIARIGDALAEPLGESRSAMDNLKATKASTRRELYQRLERARGFLHAHDDRAVTLAELASVAGLSQFHLVRYFKMAFGSSPISYHRGLRLGRVSEMMSGRSMADVAGLAGYADESSFSHAFRRRFGTSPSQWRRSARAA